VGTPRRGPALSRVPGRLPRRPRPLDRRRRHTVPRRHLLAAPVRRPPDWRQLLCSCKLIVAHQQCLEHNLSVLVHAIHQLLPPHNLAPLLPTLPSTCHTRTGPGSTPAASARRRGRRPPTNSARLALKRQGGHSPHPMNRLRVTSQSRSSGKSYRRSAPRRATRRRCALPRSRPASPTCHPPRGGGS